MSQTYRVCTLPLSQQGTKLHVSIDSPYFELFFCFLNRKAELHFKQEVRFSDCVALQL